jgi:hypothetical protein
MKNLKTFFSAALVVALSFGLTACQTSEDSPMSPAMTGAAAVNKTDGRIMPAQTTGYVTVIHGVPGLIVDVYVNGTKTLPSFAPNTVTGMLELPEGNYDIVIVPEGGDPATPAISGSAFLNAGANVSIVAHLDAAGSPTLGVFVNDVSDIMPGKTRLAVRHTAAAPEVDVALYRGARTGNYVATLMDLANGNEAAVDVRPGRYSATLAPAGVPEPVFGPATVVLNPKVLNIVYAVGSLSDGSLTLLTQTIDLNYSR